MVSIQGPPGYEPGALPLRHSAEYEELSIVHVIYSTGRLQGRACRSRQLFGSQFSTVVKTYRTSVLRIQPAPNHHHYLRLNVINAIVLDTCRRCLAACQLFINKRPALDLYKGKSKINTQSFFCFFATFSSICPQQSSPYKSTPFLAAISVNIL